MPKLQLRILASESAKYEKTVDMVIVRCIYEDLGSANAFGDLGILPGHMPLSAVLGSGSLNGTLRILDGGIEQRITLFGGIVNVRKNLITILTKKYEDNH